MSIKSIEMIKPSQMQKYTINTPLNIVLAVAQADSTELYDFRRFYNLGELKNYLEVQIEELAKHECYLEDGWSLEYQMEQLLNGSRSGDLNFADGAIHFWIDVRSFPALLTDENLLVPIRTLKENFVYSSRSLAEQQIIDFYNANNYSVVKTKVLGQNMFCLYDNELDYFYLTESSEYVPLKYFKPSIFDLLKLHINTLNDDLDFYSNAAQNGSLTEKIRNLFACQGIINIPSNEHLLDIRK